MPTLLPHPVCTLAAIIASRCAGVNGVVTALTALVADLEKAVHEVRVIHPGLFVTVVCSTYREIRLAAAPLAG